MKDQFSDVGHDVPDIQDKRNQQEHLPYNAIRTAEIRITEAEKTGSTTQKDHQQVINQQKQRKTKTKFNKQINLHLFFDKYNEHMFKLFYI